MRSAGKQRRGLGVPAPKGQVAELKRADRVALLGREVCIRTWTKGVGSVRIWGTDIPEGVNGR